MSMQYTTLGRTGLKVSVAGLGCGGFSRLGLAQGASDDEAARLVCEAFDLGINLIDTAPVYGTETAVGKALAAVRRDDVIVSTKAFAHRGDALMSPEDVLRSLENSLRCLQTDYVDILQLHGVPTRHYAYAREALVPALQKAQQAGKVRFLGVTEAAVEDFEHDMLALALQDDVWDVMMLAFNMMHQNARRKVLPATLRKRIGTMLMFVVRSVFADRARVKDAVDALVKEGHLDQSMAEGPGVFDFLLKPGVASSLTDAAYRFARYEPGADVVLFGTGDIEHLKANVSSLLQPPLPPEDRQRVVTLFSHLVGVGVTLSPQQRGG